jgi:hypothetical protein
LISVEVNWGAGIIRKGCEALGVVVISCGIEARAGGVGAMFFDSLVLIIQTKFARLLLVMQVASTCSANCFSIAWNHLMSIAKDLTVF